MNSRDARKRLQAAQILLLEPSTTREKFTAIRNLISGINPTLDAVLARCDRELSTVDKVFAGDVIHLAADNLPENTEEEKKRKRWLLFFIKSWNELKTEVARAQQELSNVDNAETGVEKTSALGKLFNFAKGPFGIITALAVAGVVAMQTTAVQITIQNQGCGTMKISGSVPISIPGLKLPKEDIPNGGSADVVLPGLTVNVDGTSGNAVLLSVLTYSIAFQLPSNIVDVTMNGESLLGKKTAVKLSEKDKHTLALICL